MDNNLNLFIRSFRNELTEEDKDEIKEKIKKIFRDDEKDSPLKRPFSFWL